MIVVSSYLNLITIYHSLIYIFNNIELISISFFYLKNFILPFNTNCFIFPPICKTDKRPAISYEMAGLLFILERTHKIVIDILPYRNLTSPVVIS